MAFQPAPDTAEAVMNYEAAGVPIVNVMNFEKVGGYDQVAIDLLAAVVDAAIDAYLIPLINSGVTYLFTHVRGLASAIDLEADDATSTQPGSAAGGALPSQQSYAVKLGTGFTGRSARGRIYMPPTSDANQNGVRQVSTTYSDNAVDAIADLIEDCATAGWNAVVLSRQSGGVLLPTAVGRVITDVIGANLNIDTQRRRVGK